MAVHSSICGLDTVSGWVSNRFISTHCIVSSLTSSVSVCLGEMNMTVDLSSLRISETATSELCCCACLVMVLSPKSSKFIYKNTNIGSSQVSAAHFVPCKSLGADTGALCWQNTARLYFLTTTQVRSVLI